MSEIKISCIETARKKAKRVWTDSGKENLLTKHKNKEVCLELKKGKKFKVDENGEEIPISDYQRSEIFREVENVFLEPNIPVYRQVT